VRVRSNHKFGVIGLVAIAWLSLPPIARAATEEPVDDAALSAAICPIVYPVDQSASPRGAHFLFYGNGFFINKDGYLLTVAHVLSQLHGGQPYVLLRTRFAPPKIVQAALVAIDRDHDIAILRVRPNPFEGNYDVSFLPIAYDRQRRGETILAAARRPPRPKDAYTTEAFVEERSPGEVYDFQFSQLDKGRSDTELFLFNHQVQFGQSGAPILSANSREVVGLVEGQWLRSSLVPVTTAVSQGDPGVGAAIPIHYAIALLQQKGIAWQTASGVVERPDITAATAKSSSPPAPLSLVPAPYPWESLFGGEVVLDVLIDAKGRVSEVKLVRGQSPFLEKVFSTVRTWTFFPALADGHPVASRIGIAFQFSQSSLAVQSKSSQTVSKPRFEEPLPNAAERGALPIDTVEPEYASAGEAEGSMILYDLVGPQGDVTSVQVLRDLEPLTGAVVAAVRQWRFFPGKRAGVAADSAAVVVFTFRRSARSAPTHAVHQPQ
jgi:outer membrane biosynthesis protein TonB